MEPGGRVTLAEVVRLLGDLTGLMKTSFGLAGKAVLISQKSPRQVTVTKVLCRPNQSCQIVCIFSDQKIQSGYNLEGLEKIKVCIFYDHLKYFKAI
jgi:hypothetical protein